MRFLAERFCLTGAADAFHSSVVEGREGPVLCGRGEADMAAVPRLERDAAGLDLADGRVAVVDLAEATFVDSSVLAWLLSLARRADLAGADLVVRVTPGPVLAVLELTGICRELTVLDEGADRGEAPAGLGAVGQPLHGPTVAQ